MRGHPLPSKDFVKYLDAFDFLVCSHFKRDQDRVMTDIEIYLSSDDEEELAQREPGFLFKQRNEV